MPVLKRLRSWFFQITATLSNPGVRFLKYDQPTEETYRNLFESIPFFLEPDDRAKTDMQGLVHRATDAEAKGYDETEQTTKTKAVVPYQLPEVKDIVQTIIGNISTYTGNIINVRIASNISEDVNFDKRNVFIVELDNNFIAWLENELSNTLSNVNIPGGDVGQVLTKNSNLDNDYSWQYPLPAGFKDQVLVRNSNLPTDYSWQNIPYLITFHVTQNPESFYIVMPFDVSPSVAYIDSNLSIISMIPPVINANTPTLVNVQINSGTEGVVLFSLTRV